jgi:hypothetical protein
MNDRTTVGLLVLNVILLTVLSVIYVWLMAARWMGHA